VTTPDSKETEYTFDAAGNQETQQVTDGTDVTLTTYTYNAQNQLTSAALITYLIKLFYLEMNGISIFKRHMVHKMLHGRQRRLNILYNIRKYYMD
jgi:YD repeat-containing protein